MIWPVCQTVVLSNDKKTMDKEESIEIIVGFLNIEFVVLFPEGLFPFFLMRDAVAVYSLE